MTTPRFRIFFDMDGVLVDFDRLMRELGMTGDECKRHPGAYLAMRPVEGAIEGIRKVMSIAGQYGGEVWLATKPPTGIAWAYADKVSWVLNHLPELRRRIILTHDKGLLGGEGDVLVDDRPWRANCGAFRGTLIMFGWADWPRSEPCLKSFQYVRDWLSLTQKLHDHIRGSWPLLQEARAAAAAPGVEVREEQPGCYQAGNTLDMRPDLIAKLPKDGGSHA